MSRLLDYEWPGNVRELQQCMAVATVLARSSGTIEAEHIHVHARLIEESPTLRPIPLRTMEREHIIRALKYCNGQVGGEKGAADVLGMKRSTLVSRIERLGIEPRDYVKGKA